MNPNEKIKRNKRIYELYLGGMSYRKIAKQYLNPKTGKPLDVACIYRIVQRIIEREKESR